MNINQVNLAGRLTRDPEVRYSKAGKPIVQIGIAVNREWRDADGEKKEEVSFVDCTAFGKSAELISQHFTKGKPIFVSGRLKSDSWKTDDGQNRSKLGVIIDSFQFVGSRDGGGKPSSEYPEAASEAQPDLPAGKPSPIADEDVPF